MMIRERVRAPVETVLFSKIHCPSLTAHFLFLRLRIKLTRSEGKRKGGRLEGMSQRSADRKGLPFETIMSGSWRDAGDGSF